MQFQWFEWLISNYGRFKGVALEKPKILTWPREVLPDIIILRTSSRLIVLFSQSCSKIHVKKLSQSNNYAGKKKKKNEHYHQKVTSINIRIFASHSSRI